MTNISRQVVSEVRLMSKTLFSDSQQVGLDYLLRLDVDRLLAPIYEGANKKPKASTYGGWESKEIKGHSVGHYLSAVSCMYASTAHPKMKQRMDYIVNELTCLQREDGYLGGFSSQPFDITFTGDFAVDNFSLSGHWVPWYSIHKIYAGLIDAYLIGGSEEALPVVIRYADWAYEGTKSMTDEQFQRMLICEFGGMNEVMADLYDITKDRRYLELAKRFTQKTIIDPLAQGVDELQGKHANTQIPKVIGAAKLYEVTKDPYYFNAVTYFFNTVTEHYSFVIGGNSNSEHFGPSQTEMLSRDACETCNTYNMMKLAEYLFKWTKDSKYMDYYERALFNHILASQEPVLGSKIYFTSNYPGHFKVYGTLEDSFWCCTGSGMENPGRYNRQIYFEDEDTLYVNLFIASTFESADKTVKVSLNTKFPYEDELTCTFERIEKTNMTLKIRVPYWVAGKVKATFGNQVIESDELGYLTISGPFVEDESVVVKLPMSLHEYVSMDNSHKIALMYGPIVLTGVLGTEKFPAQDIVEDHLSLMRAPKIEVPMLVCDNPDICDVVKFVSLDTLTFEVVGRTLKGEVSITLKPFYDVHHERYTIYWNKYTVEEYNNLGDELLSRDERLFNMTLDVVRTGEQQSEIEHQFKGINSFAGYLGDVDMWWRDARDVDGMISYQMEFDPTKDCSLLVAYYGYNGLEADRVNRTFDILINGQLLKTEQLIGTARPEVIDIAYPISAEVLNEIEPNDLGKYVVGVMFKNSSRESVVGGILEVRTVSTII